MFGYVTIDKPELKVKEFDIYHAYYCGLCRRLHALYGVRGQMTLSYDLTFLVMLLTGLYEPNETTGNIRCLVHPIDKHPAVVNKFTDYAAAMNVLLAYYKGKDDWDDERDVKGFVISKALADAVNDITRSYPKKAQLVENKIKALREAEEALSTDLDLVSGIFGELMAGLFTVKDDLFTAALRNTGFYLGKFVYLLDAYEDLADDMKKNAYNPLIELKRTRDDFDAYMEDLLTMMISEAARAFEFLPIIKNVSILKNVLYSGVWTGYRMKREKEQHGRSV
ncbi:MAG: hypothetical protein IJR58_07105 [Lachnospiraceae bacterium]|nr:hypothetical protein [Lachnospiraceae bacterium]